MGRKRTLPSNQVLDQLYWFEGLNTREIGERYGVKRNAVAATMKRAGIKRRGFSTQRHDGCLIEGCPEPIVRIKRNEGIRTKIRWALTSRCYFHHILYRRTKDREAARRYYSRGKDRQNGPNNRKIGPTYWEIHPDDWPAPGYDYRPKIRKSRKNVVEKGDDFKDRSLPHPRRDDLLLLSFLSQCSPISGYEIEE